MPALQRPPAQVRGASVAKLVATSMTFACSYS
jgi:hypothetical protein